MTSVVFAEVVVVVIVVVATCDEVDEDDLAAEVDEVKMVLLQLLLPESV